MVHKCQCENWSHFADEYPNATDHAYGKADASVLCRVKYLGESYLCQECYEGHYAEYIVGEPVGV